MAGKKQNIDPMWKVFMKDLAVREPTSIREHVYLGCTQRECQTSKDIVDNNKNVRNPESPQEQQKIFLARRDLMRTSLQGRSCKEMRGAILLAGQLNNSTTIQSRNSMP